MWVDKGSKRGRSMRHQHIFSFFLERSKRLISLTVSIVKIALAAPRIMYLDTYNTFFYAVSYRRLVKSKNQDSEITGTIASAIIKLSLSYTGTYLQAEFS